MGIWSNVNFFEKLYLIYLTTRSIVKNFILFFLKVFLSSIYNFRMDQKIAQP